MGVNAVATHKQIQSYVRETYGYTPETCWIAHVKELCGLPVRRASNRKSEARMNPCPPDKQQDVIKALEHLGALELISEDEAILVKEAERESASAETYPAAQIREVFEDYVSTGGVVLASRYRHFCAREAPAAYGRWSFTPTPGFWKSLQRMDRKIKGRVMDAVMLLCKRPTTPHGDTIKPLSGELKGRWHYRIGDYRLIYRPDEKGRTVFLLALLPRGAAYEGQ